MADFGTVARPYARAIFDVASDANALDAWSRALAAAAVVASDHEARAYLNRPELRATERAEFLAQILNGVADAEPLTTSEGTTRLALLTENDRLDALHEVSAQFDQLKAARENRVNVQVVAASAIDGTQAEKIKQALTSKLRREVELEFEVDPSLIGGAVIRAEDMVIDGSLKTRLARLASALID
jgi:F-type H+-transporting ATPase subunit delta